MVSVLKEDSDMIKFIQGEMVPEGIIADKHYQGPPGAKVVICMNGIPHDQIVFILNHRIVRIIRLSDGPGSDPPMTEYDGIITSHALDPNKIMGDEWVEERTKEVRKLMS
jgi:hypothetical protein